MGSQADLRKLLPILEAVFNAEQMKMNRFVHQINRLNQQLLDLNQAGNFDQLSVGAIGGADVLWEAWVETRKKKINQELAIAAQNRELAKSNIIAALSKLEAAKKLKIHLDTAAQRTCDRRANW